MAAGSFSASMIFLLSDSATHRSTGVGRQDVRYDSNRCMQNPFVSQSIPRYFSTACTHSFVDATVHDFFIFDSPVSTYIGRTDRMSIFDAYSICSACDRKSLQALVAEQAEMKGIGLSPATEERLMMALLLSLLRRAGSIQWVRKVIGRILMLSQFWMRLAGISWKTPIFEIPTLLTSMETSRSLRPCTMFSKKPSRWHSAKSATMNFV